MNNEKYNFKINLKTCMLFEEYTGKSFFQCNTEEDILKLMYSNFIVNYEIKITFNAFLNMLNDNKKMVPSFNIEFDNMAKFMAQFKNKEEENSNDSGSTSEVRISDYITSLIIDYNINPHYVLYEMDIWELKPYMERIEEKYKNDMAEKRMWAYLNVMPHIDNKKCKSPQKLLPFPWEQQERKKSAEEGMKNNMYAIKHTIGQKLNV